MSFLTGHGTVLAPGGHACYPGTLPPRTAGARRAGGAGRRGQGCPTRHHHLARGAEQSVGCRRSRRGSPSPAPRPHTATCWQVPPLPEGPHGAMRWGVPGTGQNGSAARGAQAGPGSSGASGSAEWAGGEVTVSVVSAQNLRFSHKSDGDVSRTLELSSTVCRTENSKTGSVFRIRCAAQHGARGEPRAAARGALTARRLGDSEPPAPRPPPSVRRRFRLCVRVLLPGLAFRDCASSLLPYLRRPLGLSPTLISKVRSRRSHHAARRTRAAA